MSAAGIKGGSFHINNELTHTMEQSLPWEKCNVSLREVTRGFGRYAHDEVEPLSKTQNIHYRRRVTVP